MNCKVKFRLTIIFLAVIFSASCSSAPVKIPPEGRQISADISGIAHAGHSRTKTELEYMDQVGVTWVLRTFSWATFEPYKGEWDFLEFDDYVNKLNARGVKIIGILAYDNWWLYKKKDHLRIITEKELPDYLEYVSKTVEHFRGRVDAWCIWNEPNTNHFWKGTDEDFFELTRRTAELVKEIDKDVAVLGGAVNRNIPGLDEKFIRGLFKTGAMDNVDAIAFHPYELNPDRTLTLYNKFIDIVKDYGFEDKIWVTEVGYPTGGLYPTKISEKSMPEYTVKTWVYLAAAGTKRIIWYQLFDPPKRAGKNSEDFFGLVRSRRDYTSKGAEAYRLCSKYLSGTTCAAADPAQFNLPKSVRAFKFTAEGREALVLWNEGAGSKKINLKLTGENHKIHNIVTGKESPLHAELSIKAGREPVFITWETQKQE